MEWTETTVGIGVLAGDLIVERAIKLVRKMNGKDPLDHISPCNYAKDLRTDFQNEFERVRERDLKIAEDLAEIKTSITFIVTEIKNGTKFVKK